MDVAMEMNFAKLDGSNSTDAIKNGSLAEETENCDMDNILLSENFVRIPFMFAYCLVFLTCLFGNLFTILVICVHRSMRTATNFFLANLALADLLVAVFCILQNMLHLFGSETAHWPLDEIHCKIYMFVLHLVPCTSIGILVCVSVEKYIAILHPLLSLKLLITPRVRIISVLSIWLISLVCNSPYYFTTKYYRYGESAMCVRSHDLDSRLLILASFIIWYCLPLATIAYLYTRIGMVLWRGCPLNPKAQPQQAFSGSHSEYTITKNYSPSPRSVSYNQLAPSNGALIENNTYSRSENKLRTPKNRLFKLSRIKRFKAAAVRSNVPKITTTDYDNAKEDEGATQREDDGCESSGSAGSTCEEGPRERTRTRTIETALEPSETHKHSINSMDSHGGHVHPKYSTASSKCYSTCCRDNYRRPMNWNPSTIDGPKAVGIIDYRIIETESRKRIIRLLIAVVCAFAILTLLHHIRMLSWAIWDPHSRLCISNLVALVQPLSYISLFLSSSLNPFLYAFMSRRFREAIRDIMNCRIGDHRRKLTRTRTQNSDPVQGIVIGNGAEHSSLSRLNTISTTTGAESNTFPMVVSVPLPQKIHLTVSHKENVRGYETERYKKGGKRSRSQPMETNRQMMGAEAFNAECLEMTHEVHEKEVMITGLSRLIPISAV